FEQTERVLLVQTPGQQYRRGDLVELQNRPIGGAVDPAILGKTAVRPLNGGQPDQSAPVCLSDQWPEAQLRSARDLGSRRDDNRQDRYRSWFHPRGYSSMRRARLEKLDPHAPATHTGLAYTSRRHRTCRR